MNKKLNCVLFVDDNEPDNYIHKKVIERAGVTDCIEIAMNGKEAIDYLTTSWPLRHKEKTDSQTALIFLDINMPVMNGWEFLEEYGKLDEDQKDNVVIIMLSASQNYADIARAEKILGKDCYVYKPLTLESLREVIQKHFPE